jgi:hypothetical protein
MPEPTPEAWAQIRYAYENTDQPLAHICADHEITIPMLRYRMKLWEWTRRKPLIPREGPPPVAVMPSADTFLHPPLDGEGRRFERERKPTGWGEAETFANHPTPPAFADAAAGDPPRPGEGKEVQAGRGDEGDPAAIVPRLQGAIARILQAIEATIARLAAGPYHPREMEQAGRALSALTRTLRELNALLGQHKADDDAPDPRDIDEFRQELARRLKGIIAARKQRIEEAKREET